MDCNYNLNLAWDNQILKRSLLSDPEVRDICHITRKMFFFADQPDDFVCMIVSAYLLSGKSLLKTVFYLRIYNLRNYISCHVYVHA